MIRTSLPVGVRSPVHRMVRCATPGLDAVALGHIHLPGTRATDHQRRGMVTRRSMFVKNYLRMPSLAIFSITDDDFSHHRSQ
jgi:hypothetical protein